MWVWDSEARCRRGLRSLPTIGMRGRQWAGTVGILLVPRLYPVVAGLYPVVLYPYPVHIPFQCRKNPAGYENPGKTL